MGMIIASLGFFESVAPAAVSGAELLTGAVTLRRRCRHEEAQIFL